jgi:hypothetical protein
MKSLPPDAAAKIVAQLSSENVHSLRQSSKTGKNIADSGMSRALHAAKELVRRTPVSTKVQGIIDDIDRLIAFHKDLMANPPPQALFYPRVRLDRVSKNALKKYVEVVAERHGLETYYPEQRFLVPVYVSKNFNLHDSFKKMVQLEFDLCSPVPPKDQIIDTSSIMLAHHSFMVSHGDLIQRDIWSTGFHMKYNRNNKLYVVNVSVASFRLLPVPRIPAHDMLTYFELSLKPGKSASAIGLNDLVQPARDAAALNDAFGRWSGNTFRLLHVVSDELEDVLYAYHQLIKTAAEHPSV